jgi:hypothetical protein
MAKSSDASSVFLLSVVLCWVSNSCYAQNTLIAGSKSNLLLTEFSPPKEISQLDSIDIDYDGRFDIELAYKTIEVTKPSSIPGVNVGVGAINEFNVSSNNSDFKIAFMWDTTSVPANGNCNDYPNGKNELPLARVFYFNDTISQTNEEWNDTSVYFFYFKAVYYSYTRCNNFSKNDTSYFIAIKKEVDSSEVLLGYINILYNNQAYYLINYALQGWDSSIVISSVTEQNDKEDFVVYPNPANDFINVSMDKEDTYEPTTIEIFNAQGIVLLGHKITLGETLSKIDISILAKGAYFLMAKQNGVSTTIRFIK